MANMTLYLSQTCINY